MAFDEKLANRIREILSETHDGIEEKKMFGGLCFMIAEKMCATTREHAIMIRIDPDDTEKMLEKNGVRPMMRNGKIMKGFIYVDEEELKTKRQLNYWLQLALKYNLIAKSKKK